jgi:hypothetical protein
LLNAYILKRAIIGIKNITGNDRLLLAGVFSAWIAFQAQSLVSIDNIGISIWGWVLGGSIIGMSISSAADDRKQFIGRQSDINLPRVFTSSIVVMLAIIPINFLYRGEINTAIAKSNFNLQDQATQAKFKEIEMKAINSTLNDPTYVLSCAMYLIQVGFLEDGLFVVKKIHANDPRNVDAINALAMISEQMNKIPDAISYREKIVKLDPWNSVNYLALGKNYKAQGDLVKSKEILNKIVSFSTGDIGGPIAEQAKTELAS